MKVLIVGGVAGGASCAARLRRLDEKAEIIMFERGEYISYANCGLPYYIGGVIKDESALTINTPASFGTRFNIDVRTLSAVIEINQDAKTVKVQKQSGEIYTENYDKLVLSTGAEPVRPNWQAVSGERVFTLRDIPDTMRIKAYISEHSVETALVVGGGYIGVEMAENLTQLGIGVSIIEMADHLIAPLDYDMACEVHGYMQAKGVSLSLGKAVQNLVTNDAHGVTATLSSGESLCADMALLCIGVRPDTALAKAAGLAICAKGAIIVDEHMRTSHEDIYAVGDAVQGFSAVSGDACYIPLAGPANKQGRIAADNICGKNSSYKGAEGSAIAKLFNMTVACTGLNEVAANTAGIAYDKVYAYNASHAGYYPKATNMCVKLIFARENGCVLGAQIVGYDGVDKRCDVLATAIRAHMTVEELTELELCYAPPYSLAKDPVNIAGYMAQNVQEGTVHQYFWQDVATLQAAHAAMLDVRTQDEYARGHIEGTVNIPLDTLRDNLQALDKTAPIYVNCQSGLRSYFACRILIGNGFDCYNLAGGYRLYNVVARAARPNERPVKPCGAEA